MRLDLIRKNKTPYNSPMLSCTVDVQYSTLYRLLLSRISRQQLLPTADLKSLSDLRSSQHRPDLTFPAKLRKISLEWTVVSKG